MLSKNFFVSQKNEKSVYKETQGLKVPWLVIIGLLIILLILTKILIRAKSGTISL